MSFPFSFPYEWMHLVYENLMKNLIMLWTNKFKDLDNSQQPFHLPKDVWNAIWEASKHAGNTIPSVYGPRMPNSPADSIPWTSSIMAFWTQFLAPTLLCRQFKNAAYHAHFIELVKLMNICLQFTMKRSDIDVVREGFVKWVLNYEKYQYFLLISYDF